MEGYHLGHHFFVLQGILSKILWIFIGIPQEYRSAVWCEPVWFGVESLVL